MTSIYISFPSCINHVFLYPRKRKVAEERKSTISKLSSCIWCRAHYVDCQTLQSIHNVHNGHDVGGWLQLNKGRLATR
jgi:succinate dehydrogenase/fumarate reductase-like Fe-S protein